VGNAGGMFRQNVSVHLQGCTLSQLIKRHSEHKEIIPAFCGLLIIIDDLDDDDNNNSVPLLNSLPTARGL
jgi:hypothetical protein